MYIIWSAMCYIYNPVQSEFNHVYYRQVLTVQPPAFVIYFPKAIGLGFST